MKTFIILLIMFTTALLPAKKKTRAQVSPLVTGKVYFDENKNGERDKKEIGIPLVHVQFYHMVSQIDNLVHTTDIYGNFHFPLVMTSFQVPPEGFGKLKVYPESMPTGFKFTTLKNRVFGPSKVDLGVSFEHKWVKAKITPKSDIVLKIAVPKKLQKNYIDGHVEPMIGRISKPLTIYFNKGKLRKAKGLFVFHTRLVRGTNKLQFKLKSKTGDTYSATCSVKIDELPHGN